MIVNDAADSSVTVAKKHSMNSFKSVMSSPEKMIMCLGHMLSKLTQ